MKQYKRLGGDDRLGDYTEWEKDTDNYCIYCGELAETREHTPSKTLLIKPFPDNLPTIPACFKCNNGFSDDEKYVACYLDVLKSYVYHGYHCNEKTISRLEKDQKLKSLLDEQIKVVDNKVHYICDETRLVNVLSKLARGHAGYEFDHVDLDSEPQIWYDFVFNMDNRKTELFNSIAPITIMPELGSRVFNKLCISGELTFLEWIEVQDNQYRYHVYFNEDGGVSVKISIYEILYCIVDLS